MNMNSCFLMSQLISNLDLGYVCGYCMYVGTQYGTTIQESINALLLANQKETVFIFND